MTDEMFPTGFPEELAACALIAGMDAAWSVQAADRVVRWLGQTGFAVLGTELWVVLKDGRVQPSFNGAIYGNAVSHKGSESWSSYVGRAADEALRFLESLPTDVKEHENLFCNISWASESEYLKLEMCRVQR